jgi:hypothetical protein
MTSRARQLVPAVAVAVLASILGASAVLAEVAGAGPTASSIQCNYDLTNTGSADAYDVAFVVQGAVNSSSGFVNGPFTAPDISTGGGNTTLHWTTPSSPVTFEQEIHVGFTPVGTSGCPVLDIYWTDASGRRIASSFIGTAWNHLTNTSETITNASFRTITVTNVRFACQAAPLPLAALTANNTFLSQSMVTIGDSATLGPGQSWVIPVQPSCSQCHCVTNYQTTGDIPGAILSPWVQEYVQ